MSSKQTMVEPLDTVRALGDIKGFSTTDSALLKKAFSQSPIYDGTLTDESITAEYEQVLTEPINDGGYYFGEFDPTYPDAPDLESVKTGAGGLPATPYVPNVASPGVGSTDPSDLPDPPNAAQVQTNSTHGPGDPTISPSRTAKEIARTKLGDYVMSTNPGRSQHTGD